MLKNPDYLLQKNSTCETTKKIIVEQPTPNTSNNYVKFYNYKYKNYK